MYRNYVNAVNIAVRSAAMRPYHISDRGEEERWIIIFMHSAMRKNY